MAFTVLWHPDVVTKDLSRVDQHLRARMLRAVEQRLSTEPAQYGKPLSGSLQTYRRLRVGDFRIVFRVHGSEVWVFAVIHRKDVYHAVLRRLGWSPP